jgi:hypothetical protein
MRGIGLKVKTQFDELIRNYPTVVIDGIQTGRIIQLADTVLDIKGEGNLQYSFNFFRSQDKPTKYFFHVALKEIDSGRIIKTAIYEATSEEGLRELSKELKSCKDKHFDLVKNKIANNKLFKLEKPFNRKAAELAALEIMKQADAKYMSEAKSVFTNKTGLIEAITTEIFPTLVVIRTINGVFGTGFFQHSEWLVSNAHIIPCKEIINEETGVEDYQESKFRLEIESSYHRPSHRDDSPDVVVIKTKTRPANNNKCLLTRFSDDEGYAGNYIFYVDPFTEDNESQIKFLRSRSKPNTYPITYECIDGSIPQPGCSGTPIIQARVILDRVPKWQFKVIGVLYARCAPSWYNNHLASTATERVSEDTRLVCAIPIIQEFSQILEKILHPRERAVRTAQMAAAATSLGDKQGIRDAKAYSKMSAESKAAEQQGLKRFEDGETVLNISLPDGLEKLFGNTIVSVKESLLIKAVAIEKLGKSKVNKLSDKISFVDAKVLIEDYEDFLEAIKKSDSIALVAGDNLLKSPSQHFRVDIGDFGNQWKLELQDNTGKGLKSNGKSLSSVFAIVTIPKTHISVQGSQLEELFRKSQESKKAKDISLLNTEKDEKLGKGSGKKTKLLVKGKKHSKHSYPQPSDDSSTTSLPAAAPAAAPAPTKDKKDVSESKLKSPTAELPKTINYKQFFQNQLKRWEELTLQEEADLQTATENSLAEKDSKNHIEQLKVQTQEFGFDCKDVGRDGLCLLYVIEHQLKLRNIPPFHSYEQLQAILVKHIIDHIAVYKDSSVLNPHELVGHALDYKTKWAGDIGDLAGLALSRALNVTFFIIPSDVSKPKIFRRPNPRGVIFLGYEGGKHYQSLVPIKESDKTKQIQLEKTIKDYIKAEPVDTWSAVAAEGKIYPNPAGLQFQAPKSATATAVTSRTPSTVPAATAMPQPAPAATVIAATVTPQLQPPPPTDTTTQLTKR